MIEAIIIIVLLIANGLFAMSEIALVSARKPRLQQRADDGNRGAQAALDLSADPSRLLSILQIGMTTVGIFMGAFGEARISDEVAQYLATIPSLAPYREVISLAVVVICITYVFLVLGELVPKRFAIQHPEMTAILVGRPMHFLARLMSPMVSLLSASTNILLRLLGVKPSNEPPVTDDEIKVLMAQGTEAGVFEAVEQDIVARVLRLSDRRVASLMTPRTDIAWIDTSETAEDIQKLLAEHPHSRFPLCENEIDTVKGIVHVKDMLAPTLSQQPINLAAIAYPPLLVPESMEALNLLEAFKRSGMHMALIVDEYGGIQGLVTLNDVLEAVVGDLEPAAQPEDRAVIQREDGSWLVDGMLPIVDFKEVFELDELPDEDSYQTVGGFVMTHLGRIPRASDRFEWHDLRIEVMDMDGHRVDKVLIQRKEEQNEPLQKPATA